MQPRVSQRIRFIAKSLLVLFVALILVGRAYEQTVLTAGRAFTVGDPQAGEELKAFHEIWTNQLQVQLTQLSTQGRQVVVDNSGHRIGWEAPGGVVDAIHGEVTQARNQAKSE
jgi:hypothetical protein